MNLMATGDASDNRKDQRQIQLLEELAQVEKQMGRWAGATVERIEKEQEIYDAHLEERDQLVGRAIRFGLTDHPFVQHWLSEQRTFGDKDALRRFRSGLERGVNRMMSKANFYVTFHAASLLEEGMGAEEIRVMLRRKLKAKPEDWFDMDETDAVQLRNRLRSMTRQGFHKWLKQLGLIEAE